MRVKCTTVIDNLEERERFVKRLKSLGVSPKVYGDTVCVEYTGCNKVKYDMLIDTFEDRTRHTIDVNCK